MGAFRGLNCSTGRFSIKSSKQGRSDGGGFAIHVPGRLAKLWKEGGGTRWKCAACFKQFSQELFLMEHIAWAGHSEHEPRCGSCKKHCKCLDALREHLLGPLAKKECAKQFAERGCSLCLALFESHDALTFHRSACCLGTASSQNLVQTSIAVNRRVQAANGHFAFKLKNQTLPTGNRRCSVALDCEMVGGGQDGSIELCASICLMDEDENALLLTYVKPHILVTNYRYSITSIWREDLVDAMPLKVVKEVVEAILYNGPNSCMDRKNAMLLVGHSLKYDLKCLGMEYPLHLLRDTACYPPLLRTNGASNKLKYLTMSYLRYQIQEGDAHNPYEDVVASMRLYRRMKKHVHTKPSSYI
eukprot:c27377_g1_i3 orf=525-1598(+)